MPRPKALGYMAHECSITINGVVRGYSAGGICEFVDYVFDRTQNGRVQNNRINDRTFGAFITIGGWMQQRQRFVDHFRSPRKR